MHPEQHNRSQQCQERKRDCEREHLAMQKVVVVPVHLYARAPVTDQVIEAGKHSCLAMVAPGSAKIEIDKKEPTRTASTAAFQ
jgi:hypothetical protein